MRWQGQCGRLGGQTSYAGGRVHRVMAASKGNISAAVVQSVGEIRRERWVVVPTRGICGQPALSSARRLITGVGCSPTSGPGRPCSWALMFQGRSGFPYFRNVSLVHSVYRSSESIKRPSMSKRHARMAGSDDAIFAVVVMCWSDKEVSCCKGRGRTSQFLCWSNNLKDNSGVSGVLPRRRI